MIHDDGPEPPPGYKPPTPPANLRRVDRVPDDLDLSDIEHRFPTGDRAGDEDDDEDDDDMLDGMCDFDFEMAPRTDDSEIAALALFANTQFDDPEAVEARRAEWAELFGGR